MHTIFLTFLLPAQLVTATNAPMAVHFTVPAAGSYQVAATCDFLHWQIEASGRVDTASQVVAKIQQTACAEFYLVSFEP